MKVYTKTGDKGETSLLDNLRVSKNDIRVEAYGTVDELNAHIALLYTIIPDEYCQHTLQQIEKTLFVIQTHLAINNIHNYPYPLTPITPQQVQQLEQAIDTLQQHLPTMHAFIMPDAHTTCAQCHIARTVCRRCERRIISLHHKTQVDDNILMYINRLSDYLFVLARYCTLLMHAEEHIVDYNL